MIFTGNRNILYLPQKQLLSFEVSDIIVDSLSSRYDFSIGFIANTGYYHDTDIVSSGYIISLWSGDISTQNTKKVGSYNTGERFSYSGWIDTTSVGQLVDIDGIQLLDTTTSGSNYYAARLQILNNSSSGSISCNIKLNSTEIDYYLSINNFTVGDTVTGILSTNTNSLVYGSSELFYNSYEQLLVPVSPIISFIAQDTGGINLRFSDGDSSNNDNVINGIMTLDTLDDNQQLIINTNRGISTGSIWSATGYNTGLLLGTTFDGIWSGTQFIYQDTATSLTKNYQIEYFDYLGNTLDKNVYWSLTSLNTPTTSYVTGFTLTKSGEYLYPPILKFTGYYSVTGITQSFDSLLFSSGCSGNLGVRYSGIGNYGTGASGYLSVYPVTFQDIYISGVNTFYLVNAYNILSEGTGYTQLPKAIINTGQYGTGCFDVPMVYGYPVAWFRPAIVSGSLKPLADYMTGIPLYTTGLVSGGTMTGYYVTGIEMWNIGSGYTTPYLPKISFTRDPNDLLTGNITGNASGILTLTTGIINVYSGLIIELQSGTNDWTTGNVWNGTSIPLGTNINTFAIKLTISGMANTQPWSGRLNIQPDAQTSYITDTFVFAHTFDPDYNALKKNYNVVTGLIYTPNTELSFLLTQDELDTTYSTIEYTNNSLGFDLGDLEF